MSYIRCRYRFTDAVSVCDGGEFCERESFRADCADDEAILVTSANYGRMRMDRCVKTDYGSLGCTSDVLANVDRLCSGRQHCEFPISVLQHARPCPNDLINYLEANYRCVKGAKDMVTAS